MMRGPAIAYRARSDLRRRWRAWVLMGVLLGMAGGAAISAAAGARRTESAYPRFLQAQNSLDVLADVRGPDGIPIPVDQVRDLPMVEDAAAVLALFGSDVLTEDGRRLSFPDVFLMGSHDGRFGTEVNRSKIIEGRRPNPSDDGEALVGFAVAQRFGVKVGDRLTIRILEFDDAGFGATGTILAEHPIEAVGIGAMPGEFHALAGASIPSLQVTPAFLTRFAEHLTPDEAFAVRLRSGVSDGPAFMKEARERGHLAQIFYEQPTQTDAVRRSARFQAVALWLLAGLTALAAIAILGQALARQAWFEAEEDPLLIALGMSRGQLLMAGAFRSFFIAFVGALLAAAVAVASSPLMPVGLARIAEPHPGIAFDLTAIGIGAATILLLSVVASAIPQWRAARAVGRRAPTARPVERGSRLAARLAQMGVPAPVVAGTRLALEVGRGRSAVPVRSALVSVALGVLALASALTLGSSMHHLVSTPALSGWTFDMVVGGAPDEKEAFLDALVEEGVTLEQVEGFLPSVRLNGEQILDAALVLPGGTIGPAMAEGRAPERADEIGLGRDTMRAEGVGIGDRVTLELQRDDTADVNPESDLAVSQFSEPRSFIVVGRVIMPSIGFNLGSAGEGVALSPDGYVRFGETDPFDPATFVRFPPDADLRRVVEHVAADYPGLFLSARPETGLAGDVARIQGVPLVLAGILGIMALATMVHALMTTIKRRARDLAILRTIGFVGSQVRVAVAWQATVVVLFALLIGAPLGIVAGRWGWLLFADTLGVVTVAVTPVVASLLAVPVVLIAANLVAAVPARAAARTQPALVLRAE